MKSSYPFISDVKIEKSKTLKIILHGNWPTPSWKLKKIDTHVKHETKKILVEVIGESKGGIAMQVLKPFTYEYEIELDLTFSWEMLVKGRSNDFKLTI